MSVELRPLGVRCNIRCRYCYQNPERDAGNAPHAYSIDAMKAGIAEEGGPFVLFGGEALLVHENDLRELWSWGFREYGRNGIQTNGTLISENHIDMFRKYQVHVGISIDGPGELNDLRWSGSLARTREATARTQAVIERLCREQIAPSLIVTLHRRNATRDKLPVMHDWFRDLERLGVRSVRLHILEVDGEPGPREYALSHDENLEAFLSFARLEQELTTLSFDVFRDMKNLLAGRDDNTTCVWNACDPYTTRAVQGVEGNGQRSNCGRTNKDGVDYTKAERSGYERYLALYNTPQEFGGCRDCRFFLMCKGQCPGTSIEGDWRNRTADCSVWKGLYREFEREAIENGQIPLSIRSDRKRLEGFVLNAWAAGQNMTIAEALQKVVQGTHVAPPPLCTQAAWKTRGLRPWSMERLDFVLPEFTRINWASEHARQIHEPRFARIRKAWLDIEWLSIIEGVRSCCAVVVSMQDILQRAGEWAKHGLTSTPVDPQALTRDTNSNTCARPAPGEPLIFRMVLGRPKDAADFKDAFDAGNDQDTGKLLGYPYCCINFLRETWVRHAIFDTTWPMAAATAAPPEGTRRIEVTGPPEANILWRWMGLRAIPHLPCRVDCTASVELGQRLIDIGRQAGYGEEMDWLMETLNWPVEWSSLHGIAEIKTPILRISARSDTLAYKYLIRRIGHSYPREGVRGLVFPFQPPSRPLFSGEDIRGTRTDSAKPSGSHKL